MKTNMTTKEIKELALQILNRNGESGIKKSDFTVKQAKQLIKEYNLGWMKQERKNKNMKEYIFTELGYFTEKECENIKNALDGKTYMNFSITWSNCAGNCTLIVRTNYEDTEENIKRFFFHVALSELASK